MYGREISPPKVLSFSKPFKIRLLTVCFQTSPVDVRKSGRVLFFNLEIIYCFNIFVSQHLGSSLAVVSCNKSNILCIEGVILFINSSVLYTILWSWFHQCVCACVCPDAHKDLVSLSAVCRFSVLSCLHCGVVSEGLKEIYGRHHVL